MGRAAKLDAVMNRNVRVVFMALVFILLFFGVRVILQQESQGYPQSDLPSAWHFRVRG